MEFELYHRHEWDVSTTEAVQIQKELAEHVVFEPLQRNPETVAGVDVSFQRTGYKQYDARCGIAVLSLPELEIVDSVQWEGEVTFPYVPGLLSFREIPAVMEALGRLRVRPDVLMTDGQGYAHPRRMGLACHLGVALEIPSLGVAKSRLIGTHGEPDTERGAHMPLYDGGEIIGVVLRTRTGVRPVYVSIGHRMLLDDAIHLALRCAPRYKIPEPTRAAHRLSRQAMHYKPNTRRPRTQP